MNKPSDGPAVRNITPWKAFASVFLAILLVMLLATALITFIMPESFVGVARVHTTTPEQIEIFQSRSVLVAVAEQLSLPRRFAQRYGESAPLSLDRTFDLLRREVQVRRVRNADITEIRAYSLIPAEAAEFANAIAQTGITNAIFTATSDRNTSPRILDLAVPDLKPVRPSKPLNFALGTLVGSVLGIMAGGVAARLALGYGQGSRIQLVGSGSAQASPRQ